MNKIYLLIDYLDRFGSKQNDFPYRSGMDKSKLKQYFSEYGFESVFVPFSEVDFKRNEMIGQFVLYTSQEDPGYFYKNFIEDIIYGLELSGAKVIPPYKYLKANNNKVFMEILRDQLSLPEIKNIKSIYFGTIEECLKKADCFEYPIVIKCATGAQGKNVALANSKKDLIKKIKKITRTRNYKEELKEIVRSLKYNGYKKESEYRNKFIIQNFIQGLENDWKVLVYCNKCYILYRQNRKNDFRASGSGNFIFRKDIPDGILDFAYSVQKHFRVPHISLDIGFDGNNFYLIEFQFVYFGTITLEKAPFYFQLIDKKWIIKEEISDLEAVYVQCIVEYMKENY